MVCFKHGENSETGMFRKKPWKKMVYNLFAGDNGKLYSYMNMYKSTIMQIMSRACVKSTLMAMETSDSIIVSSIFNPVESVQTIQLFLKYSSKLTFI